MERGRLRRMRTSARAPCGTVPHRALDELDAGLQVEAEVQEGPGDALALVLLLLQHEHGVVEELLQLLVGVVDAQLLKGVELRRGTCERGAGAGRGTGGGRPRGQGSLAQTWKISKPAMSRMPRKEAPWRGLRSRARLRRRTSQRKRRS